MKVRSEHTFSNSYLSPKIQHKNLLAMMEAERAKIEQMTAAWDDPSSTDWGNDEQEVAAEPEPAADVEEVAYRCLALYNYTVRSLHN